MAEYIDRKALIGKLEKRYCAPCKGQDGDLGGDWCRFCMVSNAIKEVQKTPAADVEPVKHGRCKKSDGKDEWYTYYYTCVECGANMMVADSDYHDVSPNYCPNCGAKMDGGSD